MEGLRNVIEAVKADPGIKKLIYTSSFFALGPTDGYVADETQVWLDSPAVGLVLLEMLLLSFRRFFDTVFHLFVERKGKVLMCLRICAVSLDEEFLLPV